MSRPPFDIASSRIPHLAPDKLQAGIRELRWCKEELTNLDVLSIDDRADPRITALEAAIDDALLALFDKKSPEFHRFRRESLIDNACFSLAYPTPIHEIRQGLRAGLDDALERLGEVIGALEAGLAIAGVDPEPPPLAGAPAAEARFARPEAGLPPGPPAAAQGGARLVYVAASRNGPAKAQLVGFLSAVDLDPVPVEHGAASARQESPSPEEARRAAFAVVLLTPDDIRTLNDPQTAPDFRPCPSQEVIFDLGFFVGALGTDRVCAVLADKAEFSVGQFQIATIEMDPAEGWKLVLAKRIKSMGVPIDLNRAI